MERKNGMTWWASTGQLWGLETRKGCSNVLNLLSRRKMARAAVCQPGVLGEIFVFGGWFLNDLQGREIRVRNRRRGDVQHGKHQVWVQCEPGCVKTRVLHNVAQRPPEATAGCCSIDRPTSLWGGCAVLRSGAYCTSPSLVSTVRTMMLLFTWASGVLVSKLVSDGGAKGKNGEHKNSEYNNDVIYYCILLLGIL